MPILSSPFKALVIGSSGTIGSAFCQLLEAHPDCEAVIGIHRQSTPSINYADVASIADSANDLASQGPFQLIINTCLLYTSPSPRDS